MPPTSSGEDSDGTVVPAPTARPGPAPAGEAAEAAQAEAGEMSPARFLAEAAIVYVLLAVVLVVFG